jgi:hypothetical protein
MPGVWCGYSELAMDVNHVVGTVPAGVASLTGLTYMHLEVNCLTIENPAELLSSLANAITGYVPTPQWLSCRCYFAA